MDEARDMLTAMRGMPVRRGLLIAGLAGNGLAGMLLVLAVLDGKLQELGTSGL